jgi:nitrate reductase gamma subunit
MYEFLTGPMFYISIAVFVIGLLVRALLYIRGLDWKLDRVAYRAHPGAGFKGALRSILFWLLPFGARSWRVQPFMTVVFFVFHIGAVALPLFLMAHNLVLAEKFGFSFFTLPPLLADGLTWALLVAAVLLLLRRIALPEVRSMSTAHDYFILALSAAPFVTGLICRYAAADTYSTWLIVHIIAGELLLILAPFTKLSHIVLFFMSRAQIGMDFGIKRGGMKGKGMAW